MDDFVHKRQAGGLTLISAASYRHKIKTIFCLAEK